MKTFRRFVTFLINLLFWLAISGLLGLIIFNFSGSFKKAIPFKTYVVQSGSMEPAIRVGDLIVITPQSEYLLNETITFQDAQERVVTHRIIEVLSSGNSSSFITKGDANPVADTFKIQLEQVIGKVVLVVPKIGWMITFTKSYYGIILLIVLPAGLIIFDEIFKISRILNGKKT